jgi:hypothetical protein
LTRRWGIQHSLTTAYSKEENAIVERANKEVNRYIRNIMFDTDIHDAWPDYIKLLQKMFNTTIKQSTGTTPNNIILGIQKTDESEMFEDYYPYEKARTDTPRDMQLVLDKILSRKHKLVNIAAKHQQQINEENLVKRYEKYEHKPRIKRRPTKSTLVQFNMLTASSDKPKSKRWVYNIDTNSYIREGEGTPPPLPQTNNELNVHTFKPTEYNVGDYVLKRNPHTESTLGPVNKYSAWWKGPYRVTYKRSHNRFDKFVYQIQNLVTDKTYEVDATHIKPFYYDPAYVNPLHIAIRDTHEYVVEQIIDHKKVQDVMHWKVRWAGYTPNDDTWEPYDNLKDNDAFISYCRKHKMYEYVTSQRGRKRKRSSNKDA